MRNQSPYSRLNLSATLILLNEYWKAYKIHFLTHLNAVLHSCIIEKFYEAAQAVKRLKETMKRYFHTNFITLNEVYNLIYCVYV